MRVLKSGMFPGACALALAALTTAARAETNDVIAFHDRIETITNLQGRVYDHVKLVRGDLDGLIYLNDSGGGRISYTNLPPEKLEELGIDTNRIAVAAERAAMSAEERKKDYERRKQRADANIQQFEQQSQAQAQAQAAANSKTPGNSPPAQKHGHKKNQNPPASQSPPPPPN
jgi:hypothetical protein